MNKAGNLVVDKDGYGRTYDYENRIVEINDVNGTTVAEFTYDGLGRRIKKTDSITSANTVLYYYNDNWQVLCERTGSDVFKFWYVYGNYVDEVLMYSFTSWPFLARYYLHDHLYSPVALVGYNGAVMERYSYDAYGEPNIMDADYNPRASSLYDNPYMFTGRRVDYLDGGKLKVQFNRNRYYDYETGRWTTHDPIGYGDGMNLYQYVKSNPIVSLDPSGLKICCKTRHRRFGENNCRKYGVLGSSAEAESRGFCGKREWSKGCSQEEIPNPDGCSAEQACCAHYSGRRNTTVYHAKEHAEGCCWCSVYVLWGEKLSWRNLWIAHAWMYVECGQGQMNYAADIDPPDWSPNWPETFGQNFGVDTKVHIHEDFNLNDEDNLEKDLSYRGDVSCEAAEKWRKDNKNRPTGWSWLHTCSDFAMNSILQLGKMCP